MSELANYGLRLTDVVDQVSELPVPLRDPAWKILTRLGEIDGDAPARWTQRVYRNDSAALEVFYEVDPKTRQINVRQVCHLGFRPRVKVFFSYSRKDVKWLNELREALEELEKRDQLVGLALLTDERLDAGDKWRARLTQFITESRFAVLIVTDQFMKSEFILNDELPLIIERHHKGEQEIHWILFEKVEFAPDSPFKWIQAAHTPLLPPLCDCEPGTRKLVYEKFAKRLQERLEQVTNARE